MWDRHVNLSPMMVPRNFNWLTRERHLSFTQLFTSRSDFLTDLKTMKHDFSTFKDYLFTCNHMETSFNSELSCVSIALRSSPLINMLMSSANIIVKKYLMKITRDQVLILEEHHMLWIVYQMNYHYTWHTAVYWPHNVLSSPEQFNVISLC